jgi:hypothetical protein
MKGKHQDCYDWGRNQGMCRDMHCDCKDFTPKKVEKIIALGFTPKEVEKIIALGFTSMTPQNKLALVENVLGIKQKNIQAKKIKA